MREERAKYFFIKKYLKSLFFVEKTKIFIESREKKGVAEVFAFHSFLLSSGYYVLKWIPSNL